MLSRARALGLVVIGLVGCNTGPERAGTGAAEVLAVTSAALSQADVAKVGVDISAADMTPMHADLARVGTKWQGVIGGIPAGTDRDFHGRATDAVGALLYEGNSPHITIERDHKAFVALVLQQEQKPDPFFNTAPQITSVVASKSEVAPHGTVTLRVTATDVDQDALTYEWSSTAGSFVDATAAATTWTAGEAGSPTLTVRVRDTHGATAAVSFTIHVTAQAATGSASVGASFNDAPTVERITIDRSPLGVGQIAQLGVNATDVDGDAIAGYAWSTTCNGAFDDATLVAPKFTLTSLPASGSSCAFSVTVTDARGAFNSGTLSIQTGEGVPLSEPPVIDRVFQAADTAAAGEALVFRALAHDPGGSAVTYQWHASAGTVSTPTTATDGSSEVVWTAPAGFTGSALVSVDAVDAAGESTTHAFTVNARAAVTDLGTQTVGSGGGTLGFQSAVSIEVPAGAVATTVNIHASAVGESTFLFEPRGQTFATPITVHLPYNPALGTPFVLWSNATHDGFEKVAATIVGSEAIVQTTHFSSAVVVYPFMGLPGPAVCGDSAIGVVRRFELCADFRSDAFGEYACVTPGAFLVHEECDDGNTTTESCAPGQNGCTVCRADCTLGIGANADPVNVCGDGDVGEGEECDGAATLTCTDHGFRGGSASCTAECTNSVSSCQGYPPSSIAFHGGPGFAGSGYLGSSFDGRYLAWWSDTGGWQGAFDAPASGLRFYLTDRTTNQSIWMTDPTGSAFQPNGPFDSFSLDFHGDRIAFRSESTNVPGVTHQSGVSDCVVWTRATKSFERIPTTGTCLSPQLSKDGNFVALAEAGRYKLYDRTTQQFQELEGTTPNSVSTGTGRIFLSDDARFAAFISTASNLVPNDTNAASDIFVRDRVAGTTTRVSLATDGGQLANGVDPSEWSASTDVRHVGFFASQADALGNSNPAPGAFEINLKTMTTHFANVAGNPAAANFNRMSVNNDGDLIWGFPVYSCPACEQGHMAFPIANAGIHTDPQALVLQGWFTKDGRSSVLWTHSMTQSGLTALVTRGPAGL